MASAPAATADEVLQLAIRHVNAGLPERALLLCEHAVAEHPPHPGVLQLMALLSLRLGHMAPAHEHAQASLGLRPDHLPTLMLGAEAARAAGDASDAARLLERAVALAPDHADAWFQLALARQDLHRPGAAAEALQVVLRLAPERAEAQVNLGIVLQELGRVDDAMRAYARAYRLREDSFGRIAHALCAPSAGRLWLQLDELRAALRASA